MAVLVTGGAGYIGSHMVAELLARKEEVVVVDSLETGHRDAVIGGKLYVGDLRDADFLTKVFQENAIDAVIHFAANSLVGESMTNPGKYYHNNVYGTLCLLDAMKANGVKRIVFSSTAATYGEPDSVPISEDARTSPTNTYGESKLAMEKMMKWYDVAHDIKYVALRYFNAAGAHASGRIGEDHHPETHLIPLILQVPLGKREFISIYGDDYATEDGTCIRDYLHVSDLADAHVLALARLRAGEASSVYNLGSGKGYSVKQVIEAARSVTGHPIPAMLQERRAGDPAALVASSAKAEAELGWKRKFDSMEAIIASAWAWHQAHPDGYTD